MLTGSLYLCLLDRAGTSIPNKKNFWIEIKKRYSNNLWFPISNQQYEICFISNAKEWQPVLQYKHTKRKECFM